MAEADLILTSRFPSPVSAVLPPFVWKLDASDPGYYAWTEGNVWMKRFHTTLSLEEAGQVEEISRRNFLRLEALSKNKSEAVCFLTGPSFEEYRNFSFSPETLTVICNTIVRDEEFLEHIGDPDILTFADCVFHFGPSRYAAEFRRRAVEVVRRSGCFLVVPHETVPLILARYPDLHESVIGLRKAPVPTFPSPANPAVMGTKSIVTYIMLPLASTLVDSVGFIGADGRDPKENYFWKHNPKVQFKDLMDTVFETHPSFFRDRVYGADYHEHCKTFERLVRFGEEAGKRYFSLTPSFIPAMASRRVSSWPGCDPPPDGLECPERQNRG